MSEPKKASEPVEPTRYDRNKAHGYNELDTYVGYDIQTGVYYDTFGKTLTEDEVDARRALKAKRVAEIKAEKMRLIEEAQRKAEEAQREAEEAQREAEETQKPNGIGVALDAFCRGVRGESIK